MAGEKCGCQPLHVGEGSARPRSRRSFAATLGIGRRVGNRWIINVKSADALLAESRRTRSEATLGELLPDHPGYSTAGALGAALARAWVRGRWVVADDGTRQWVFDRNAARLTV